MLNLEGLGLTEEQMQFLGAMNNANALETQETEGNDPANMSEEEMKRYSESVAQAADVVNNESLPEAATGSIDKLSAK